jgi:hypothetical protein
MEEQAAPSALWLFIKGLFVLFIMYLVIGFALGLGMWMAWKITHWSFLNPDKLFKWIEKTVDKIKTPKDGSPTDGQSYTQE